VRGQAGCPAGPATAQITQVPLSGPLTASVRLAGTLEMRGAVPGPGRLRRGGPVHGPAPISPVQGVRCAKNLPAL
jgi:hypothetical protein